VLYPKAIEYFSAFDNNTYNDLLNRMQSLLQREDIQIVLASLTEEKKEEPVPVKPNTNETLMTPNPNKPKIDFNVSEEDIANHKKQMEEERKAEEPIVQETKANKDPAPAFAIGGGSDSEDD
jgi:hypothetical protein